MEQFVRNVGPLIVRSKIISAHFVLMRLLHPSSSLPTLSSWDYYISARSYPLCAHQIITSQLVAEPWNELPVRHWHVPHAPVPCRLVSWPAFTNLYGCTTCTGATHVSWPALLTSRLFTILAVMIIDPLLVWDLLCGLLSCYWYGTYSVDYWRVIGMGPSLWIIDLLLVWDRLCGCSSFCSPSLG